ncbi:MAG: serine/threonine protein kinase [Deltaproteobacteria bacterium]|nr:serine/threonine protein kinase [Deltaproteobacteria bacterium]
MGLDPAMPILTDEERLGTTLAERYRLERLLGRGGMGTVFAGTHVWTRRPVAVKILHHDYARDPGVVRRFLAEARTAATLTHRHVVDVLDMGSAADGTVFLVLERLQGRNLASLLERRGRLTLPEAAAVLLPVMDALAAAHASAIVHRDVKPENIFLHRDPSGALVPKLLDFGIARFRSQARTMATVTGTIMGTPYYMSPEQAAGASDLDAGADVWSMGVTWYETLTGVLPFDGPHPTAVLLALTNSTPEPLQRLAPELPEAVTAALERALVRDRATRYRTMQEFLQALQATPLELASAVDDPQVAEALGDTSDTVPTTPRPTPTEAEAQAPRANTHVSWSFSSGVQRLKRRPLLALGILGVGVALGTGMHVLLQPRTPPAALPVTSQTTALPASTTPTPAPAPSPPLATPVPAPAVVVRAPPAAPAASHPTPTPPRGSARRGASVAPRPPALFPGEGPYAATPEAPAGPSPARDPAPREAADSGVRAGRPSNTVREW